MGPTQVIVKGLIAQKREEMMGHLTGVEHCALEWGFTSSETYADPFTDVELDVLIRDTGGRQWRVPAYWAGGDEWRVRFAPPASGEYTYRTACTTDTDGHLHGREGTITARAYHGDNSLLKHGFLRPSSNRRYLEHQDGTPFFWLGDTWWMGLAERLTWPEGFQTLAANRRERGFTVIQLVMGLFPLAESQFDPRCCNEAGHPWEEGYSRVRPEYFDMADLRIQWLVRSGLVPYIFACWGYYLRYMGVENAKRMWRYLVARYGAYPVVWCLAGEATSGFYAEDRKRAEELQKDGWTEVGRYVKEIDPYHHPLTIHPAKTSRDCVHDASILDFDMLQTGGHDGWNRVDDTVETVCRQYAAEPTMPVINAEVCYEGHQHTNWQDVQRLAFWVNMMSGACGYTYGAAGLWQMNSGAEQFGGPTPAAVSRIHEDTTWEEAARYPGAVQVGRSARLLQRYEWWRFEPHLEWVSQPRTTENYKLPYAAGIPGAVRFIYVPHKRMYCWDGPKVTGIEAGLRYRAYYFDIATGQEVDLGAVEADEQGSWQAPDMRYSRDAVLVMERVSTG